MQLGTGRVVVTVIVVRSGRIAFAIAFADASRSFAIAFAIKVPIFPFHSWLPDAHTEAPTAGSIILAGILLKMGTYGFVRFAFPLFPYAAVSYVPIIAVLSVIGIIYGALVALVLLANNIRDINHDRDKGILTLAIVLGQRKGLGIGGLKESDEEPWYVVEKDLLNNILKVAQGHDHPAMFHNTLGASQLNWIAEEIPDFDSIKDLSAKIRYRQQDQHCTVEKAGEIGRYIVEDYTTDNLDSCYLVYNEFKSAISQEVVIEPFLPIEPMELAEDRLGDFIYEPSQGALLDSLLPMYVEVEIYRALLESVASEHGARMTAMDSATNNASDLIDRLTLQYNRARQAAITKELMEIIGGAEALKG